MSYIIYTLIRFAIINHFMGINKYQVFGLNIHSEMKLPELIESRDDSLDVSIKFGKTPNNLKNAKWNGVLFEAAPGEFLFKMKNVGTYYVKEGNLIIIQPVINADISDLRIFLLSTCLGIIILQRGLLPLHGSSFSVDDNAIIVIGATNSGKSTLAAGFYHKGYTVISDDISVVSSYDEDKFIVQPGIPHLKLWKDVLEYFNYSGKITKIRSRIEKYRIYNTDIIDIKPAQIIKILYLSPSNNDSFKYEKIQGTEKFYILLSNVYRGQFIESLGKVEDIFNTVSRLANKVDLFRVSRPRIDLKINELVDFIERKIFTYNEN